MLNFLKSFLLGLLHELLQIFPQNIICSEIPPLIFLGISSEILTGISAKVSIGNSPTIIVGITPGFLPGISLGMPLMMSSGISVLQNYRICRQK